jgi:hypothetical protein
MSDLETQIKELERKLALKKAYLSIDIKLPKGVADDIRQEIEHAVKQFCSDRANDVPQSSGGAFVGSPFTDIEIAALKELAAAVTGQKSSATQPAQAASLPKKPEANKPLMAVLQTTDNIAPERRKLIASNTEVQVVSYNDKEVCFMYQKNRFVVPIEDVEFQNQ